MSMLSVGRRKSNRVLKRDSGVLKGARGAAPRHSEGSGSDPRNIQKAIARQPEIPRSPRLPRDDSASARKQRTRWKLYPKNSSPSLDPALFKNPTAEYRGTPFWSWNTGLDHDQLFR